MATHVIMPALGMAQETGTLVRWLKTEGERVAKGEALAEIMTDKATVELEAPADGVLSGVAAADGEEVPVGRVIATIAAAAEAPAAAPVTQTPDMAIQQPGWSSDGSGDAHSPLSAAAPAPAPGVAASPLAARIAAGHKLDWTSVPATGRRVQKADVLAFLDRQQRTEPAGAQSPRLRPASPKARRLARELGQDLQAIQGRGPGGAVLAADVHPTRMTPTPPTPLPSPARQPAATIADQEISVAGIWRVMAERTTQSWRDIPHFFLLREVNAVRLIAWRDQAAHRLGTHVTYTDLLVRVAAATLRSHPRLNASWHGDRITLHRNINIGLAVAVEDGLVVPVLHQADRLTLLEIARRREELTARAQANKLRPDDLADGTFTISNLGMYGVDAFSAIVPSPQAAILAVGRIAERVVPVAGAPGVQPMMAMSLSCDHRVIDGARAAQFLASLAGLLEEPLGLVE